MTDKKSFVLFAASIWIASKISRALHLDRMLYIFFSSHMLALEPRFSDSERNLNANAYVADQILPSRKYTGYVIGTVKAEE